MHGSRAGDQSRSGIGDAGGAHAPARARRSSTLAAYVALDLARRVRVLRTRAGALWLLGAASALALGIWSSQVIGIAAEPPSFTFGYHGFGTIGVWAAALIASLAGLGAVSGRVATPGRVAFGAVALGLGAVGAHALALAPLGLVPGIDWQILPLVAAFAGAVGGCMMALGAFFRGGDRTQPATLGWQATAALVLGISLVATQQLVLGAAGLGEQTGSTHANRIASATLVLLASVGSCAILGVGLLFSVLEARLRRSLRRAESELQRRSFRDGLTGLPNRLMFDGMLAQAVQQADSTMNDLPSSSSISTASSRSTSRSATPAATSCCARSPPACAASPVPRTASPTSAATNT